MILKIYNYLSSLSITKYQKTLNYIKLLENSIIIKNKNDLKIIEKLNQEISKKVSIIKKLYVINYIFYFGIYFSFFSVIFSSFFLLNFFTQIIGKIIGFFGTTILVIGVFIINKLLDLYYQDLNLLSSQIISIYTINMNKNRNSDKLKLEKENKIKENNTILDSSTNEYQKFIEYFNKNFEK